MEEEVCLQEMLLVTRVPRYLQLRLKIQGSRLHHDIKGRLMMRKRILLEEGRSQRIVQLNYLLWMRPPPEMPYVVGTTDTYPLMGISWLLHVLGMAPEEVITPIREALLVKVRKHHWRT
jgi:hypothetical protein